MTASWWVRGSGKRLTQALAALRLVTFVAPVGSDDEAARFLFDDCCDGLDFVAAAVVVVAVADAGWGIEGDSSIAIDTIVSSASGSGERLVDNISTDDILAVLGDITSVKERDKRKRKPRSLPRVRKLERVDFF